MNIRLLPVAALAIAASFGASAPARADTTQCRQISSVPTVLSEAGVYCLVDDVETSMAGGAAILITSDNVVLDCNGRGIGNLDAGSATNAIGIYATGRVDVTVRNCEVTGYLRGMQLVQGHYEVADNTVESSWVSGIVVTGDGSEITGNRVLQTGGSTLTGLRTFIGIQSVGDVDIRSNTVTDVMATAETDAIVYGIYSEQNDGGIIAHNAVRGLVPDGIGRRRGIWNSVSTDVTVWANIVALGGAGLIPGEVGIRCGDVNNGASRDNTVLGVGTNQQYALVNCPEATGDFVNSL